MPSPNQFRTLAKAKAILVCQLALVRHLAEPEEADKTYSALSALFEAGSRNRKAASRSHNQSVTVTDQPKKGTTNAENS